MGKLTKGFWEFLNSRLVVGVTMALIISAAIWFSPRPPVSSSVALNADMKGVEAQLGKTNEILAQVVAQLKAPNAQQPAPQSKDQGAGQSATSNLDPNKVLAGKESVRLKVAEWGRLGYEAKTGYTFVLYDSPKVMKIRAFGGSGYCAPTGDNKDKCIQSITGGTGVWAYGEVKRGGNTIYVVIMESDIKQETVFLLYDNDFKE
ncbi:MAG: hypothetical protein HZA34_04655 [Candidatus Pacebacteria bacterium]|nr:hypothetical protein [Candidatus Paceibacterota bacterium]